MIPGCSVDLLEFPVWTSGGTEKEKVRALESKCRDVQESGFQLMVLSFLGTVSTNYPQSNLAPFCEMILESEGAFQAGSTCTLWLTKPWKDYEMLEEITVLLQKLINGCCFEKYLAFKKKNSIK